MPRIQHRRGTASEWLGANPALAAGELGVETDTGYMKVGDGSTRWASLPYQRGPKGDTGAAGPKGDTGSAGPKGDTGSAGPKGDTGSQGETGPVGPRGDGLKMDHVVATYAQLPPGPVDGTAAIVSTTGRYYIAAGGWPAENAGVELQGAQGVPGTPGDTGPRGLPGETGPQGAPGEVTETMLDAAVSRLVDTAPEAMDTLGELADALGGDPNFATTTANAIGLRAKITDVNAQVAALQAQIDVKGSSNLALGTTSSTAMRGDRIQLVASLPGSPVAGVLYLIPK